MQFTRRHALASTVALAAAVGTTLFSGTAQAQAYPSKPITIVVAYPAGGDTDAIARLIGEKLSTRLGQPVVVDNKPGASGVIGSSFVSKAAPDGYTLLLAPSTFSIAQFVLKTGGSSSYDVLNGFTPIIQVGSLPLFLVAGPGAGGVKDVKELVAMSKAKAVTYASPGSGSPMHILGELFNKASGAKLSHVPYRGVAPALNDLIGGHVPTSFITYGPVAPHLASGKVQLLAVGDSQRTPLAPNVPTLAELGYKEAEMTSWSGLFGPKGLPADVVKTLNSHINEILKMPDVVSKLAVFGTLPSGGDPSRLEKANAADFNHFGKVIKEFGIQAD